MNTKTTDGSSGSWWRQDSLSSIWQHFMPMFWRKSSISSTISIFSILSICSIHTCQFFNNVLTSFIFFEGSLQLLCFSFVFQAFAAWWCALTAHSRQTESLGSFSNRLQIVAPLSVFLIPKVCHVCHLKSPDASTSTIPTIHWFHDFMMFLDVSFEKSLYNVQLLCLTTPLGDTKCTSCRCLSRSVPLHFRLGKKLAIGACEGPGIWEDTEKRV